MTADNIEPGTRVRSTETAFYGREGVYIGKSGLYHEINWYYLDSKNVHGTYLHFEAEFEVI